MKNIDLIAFILGVGLTFVGICTNTDLAYSVSVESPYGCQKADTLLTIYKGNTPIFIKKYD